MLRTICAGFLTATVLGPGQAAAQDAWPCEEELSRELNVAPLGDTAGVPGNEDPLLQELVAEVTARRTPIDEAEARVAGFAGSLAPAVRDRTLAKLHADILETIARERASIIDGIMRFTERQAQLGVRIQTINVELRDLTGSASAADERRRQALAQERAWDIRIFDERQGSLRYLCEQPVLLEERARTLSEVIRGELR